MSGKAVARVFKAKPNPKLSPTEQLVLLNLASHADTAGGNSYPSVRTIADEVRKSESQIHRALRRLKKRGFIICTSTAGLRKPNTYMIVWSVLEEEKPAEMGVLQMTPMQTVGGGVLAMTPYGCPPDDTRTVLKRENLKSKSKPQTGKPGFSLTKYRRSKKREPQPERKPLPRIPRVPKAIVEFPSGLDTGEARVVRAELGLGPEHADLCLQEIQRRVAQRPGLNRQTAAALIVVDCKRPGYRPLDLLRWYVGKGTA